MVKKLRADRGEGRNIGIWETRRTKNTKIIPPKRYNYKMDRNINMERRVESLQSLGMYKNNPASRTFGASNFKAISSTLHSIKSDLGQHLLFFQGFFCVKKVQILTNRLAQVGENPQSLTCS